MTTFGTKDTDDELCRLRAENAAMRPALQKCLTHFLQKGETTMQEACREALDYRWIKGPEM